MWYWAEIKEDEIRFYSEPFLREQGKLEELKRKQRITKIICVL